MFGFFSKRLITAMAKQTVATKMKLDTPQFHALFTPELKKLSELFSKNGFELRMAGGAVRDLLMGVPPADVDFATNATPTEMKELFTREKVRMFNKRGEEHGTITCRINDKENFEITTLRIDVVCDGRRAAVEFTKDWELDAFRRDLTINSLFLDLDGVVHDFTGGIEDIQRRRIAFVGDPIRRLQEDYLRILRYFRFFGRFAPIDGGHEPENLEAIIKCRDGLKNISGERLWMELHRIVVGRMAARMMRTMLVECGLGPYLALPHKNIAEFQRVAAENAPSGEEGKLGVEPSTVLAALFETPEEAMDFQVRCKCSNAERSLCELIVEKRREALGQLNNPNYFKHAILEDTFEKGGELSALIRQQYVELIKYVGGGNTELFTQIQQWEMEKFPVGGLDLMPLNVTRGPRMKCTLRHLFNLWLASDLQMTSPQLLAHIDDPEIAQLEAASKGKKKRKQSPLERHKRKLQMEANANGGEQNNTGDDDSRRNANA